MGVSSGASRGAHDKASSNSNMTASATGTTAGNENESPVKPTAAASLDQNSRRSQQQQLSQSQGFSEDLVKDEPVTEEQLIQKLAYETREEAQIELILSIRNLITACNKKKISLTNNSNFAKIIRIIDSDKHASSNVKAQLALLLCSVAKGGEQNVKVLNGSFVDNKLINLILGSQDDFLIEACLRCMRAIMSWPKVSRAWLLYEDYSGQNSSSTRQQESTDDKNLGWPLRIIEYALRNKSFVVQECVADIFATTCCRNKDQMILYNSGAIKCLEQLLESPSSRVIKAALNWLAALCLKNSTVSLELIKSTCPSGTPLMERLIKLTGKNEIQEIQFRSAKCYALIYKSLASSHMKNDPKITTHILPALVRMVHKDKPSHLRSESAECIASLIENDVKLQSTASTCDHLIDSLADMLEYDNPTLFDIRDYASQLKIYRSHDIDWTAPMLAQRTRPSQVLDLRSFDPNKSLELPSDISKNEGAQEMRRTAFLALAALASNLEVVRKRIFDTCSVVQHLVRGLNDINPTTLKSVLTCLLSLSRSVQQLRTSFAENSVYDALKNLLLHSSDEILILVLSILCNISLDFSPGRQHFLDSATIHTLCDITKGNDPYLRLHGMWILMNMVYQLSDHDLKFQIFNILKPSHVLTILETEGDEMLVLKTLGFLRNLLSPRAHIDEIMKNHGKPIMRALQHCLERFSSARVKEQALCVLTNIADGTEAKAFIMENSYILDLLAQSICDEKAGDSRVAAICCITNLAHKDHDGFQMRQNEMRQYGIEHKLKELLYHRDPILLNRVRTAYNQFLLANDKYLG